MNKLLIRQGTVVTTSGATQADVYVEGETIREIGPGLERKHRGDAPRIIDAQGCYVFPGGIDPHTHFDLPLKTTRTADDFATGSLAALHGGTTTVIDFANQAPGGTLATAIEQWHKLAEGRTACDYAFHVSVTDWNEKTRAEIHECIAKHGIPTFKTFMAYKGTYMIDDARMLEILREVKRAGGLALVHAENGDMIEFLVGELRAAGSLAAPKNHALSHPPIAEAEACGRIIDLARVAGCPLYVVHLSSEDALDRVRLAATHAEASDPPLYVETCIQYLTLDQSRYNLKGFEGARFVLSPPLRAKKDLRALWKGLSKNLIQTVATDHCSFRAEQRELGREDFTKIPNGLAGVEHRLELLYSEGVEGRKISLERFVELSSTAAAKLLGLYPRKGAIAVGSDADLVVFDPNQTHVISAKTHHMNVDYSNYEGWKVKGKVKTVVLRGTVAIEDGQARVAPGFGKYLRREALTR
ncbi:MAG: dihydropyrimidinase [Oligoflexia bacterium]|nr:dihydropyrimidinase [Oligoflexia bacterium]